MMSYSITVIPTIDYPISINDVKMVWVEILPEQLLKMIGTDFQVHLIGDDEQLEPDAQLKIQKTYVPIFKEHAALGIGFLSNHNTDMGDDPYEYEYLKHYTQPNNVAHNLVTQIAKKWDTVGYSIMLTTYAHRSKYGLEITRLMAICLAKLTQGYVLSTNDFIAQEKGLFHPDELLAKET